LVGHVRDTLQTNNLFVEFLAIPSRLTAENDEKRFATAPGSRPGGLLVREPAGLFRRRLQVLPINPTAKAQNG
jgi:hypothetical protein